MADLFPRTSVLVASAAVAVASSWSPEWLAVVLLLVCAATAYGLQSRCVGPGLCATHAGRVLRCRWCHCGGCSSGLPRPFAGRAVLTDSPLPADCA